MADDKLIPVPSGPPPPYDPPIQSTAQSSTPAKPQPPPPLRAPLPFEHPTLMKLRGQRVILASASPRRRALLAQIGLSQVEVIPSAFAEDLPKTMSPFEYVLETATQKAMAVYRAEIDNAERGEPALVLAADTVVVSHAGAVLEKPRSEREHLAMLTGLRGGAGAHRVYTAVTAIAPLEAAVSPGYALETSVEETLVRFDPKVSDEEILSYVKTREGADKAGGYGIQGIGAVLIERIEGSYDNVVGLPLRTTLRLIEKVLNPPEPDEQDGEEDAEEDADREVDLLGEYKD